MAIITPDEIAANLQRGQETAAKRKALAGLATASDVPPAAPAAPAAPTTSAPTLAQRGMKLMGPAAAKLGGLATAGMGIAEMNDALKPENAAVKTPKMLSGAADTALGAGMLHPVSAPIAAPLAIGKTLGALGVQGIANLAEANNPTPQFPPTRFERGQPGATNSVPAAPVAQPSLPVAQPPAQTALTDISQIGVPEAGTGYFQGKNGALVKVGTPAPTQPQQVQRMSAPQQVGLPQQTPVSMPASTGNVFQDMMNLGAARVAQAGQNREMKLAQRTQTRNDTLGLERAKLSQAAQQHEFDRDIKRQDLNFRTQEARLKRAQLESETATKANQQMFENKNTATKVMKERIDSMFVDPATGKTDTVRAADFNRSANATLGSLTQRLRATPKSDPNYAANIQKAAELSKQGIAALDDQDLAVMRQQMELRDRVRQAGDGAVSDDLENYNILGAQKNMIMPDQYIVGNPLAAAGPRTYIRQSATQFDEGVGNPLWNPFKTPTTNFDILKRQGVK